MRFKGKKGFTLVEVLVAATVLLYASLAFYSVYVTTTKDQVHSRQLSLATLTGESVLEEVQAHRFGMPAPASWGLQGEQSKWATVEYDVWVDGRKVQTVFHVLRKLQNGALVGQSHQNSDLVTVVISWAEGVGENPPYGEFSDVFYQGDDRHIVLQVPVWK